MPHAIWEKHCEPNHPLYISFAKNDIISTFKRKPELYAKQFCANSSLIYANLSSLTLLFFPSVCPKLHSRSSRVAQFFFSLVGEKYYRPGGIPANVLKNYSYLLFQAFCYICIFYRSLKISHQQPFPKKDKDCISMETLYPSWLTRFFTPSSFSIMHISEM